MTTLLTRISGDLCSQKVLLCLFLLIWSSAWAQEAQSVKQEGFAASAAFADVPKSSVAPRQLSKVDPRRTATSVSLLGSIPTASPARNVAVNGQFAYVCADNEITVVNVQDPSAMLSVGSADSSHIEDYDNIHCNVTNGNLVVFGDQSSTRTGTGPSINIFDLTSPASPSLLSETPLPKRFFEDPVYIGNTAFVPTSANNFFLTFQWDHEYGDLLSVDLSNPLTPSLLDALAENPISQTYGAETYVFGVTEAENDLVYIGGSTSREGANDGVGRLQVVDISEPTAMQLVGQLLIPGSIHSWAPLIQGATGVALGNTGGFTGSPTAVPADQGNIVVTVFDVAARRTPKILSINTTDYEVGPGGGAARIGNNLFAFAGVVDSNGADVLLVVDTTDPNVPVIDAIPISQPFTSMKADGSVLYVTLGTAGFATYSIPGIDQLPPFVCPGVVDTMIVLDRGSGLPTQAFSEAKTALKGFIDTLHLPSDAVGITSFTAFANLDQPLTHNAAGAKTAFDAIVPGGDSYIGAGIDAARSELLTGANANPAAFPVMVVLSDGSDLAAPNGSSTISAAAAAKAAGIQIISLQYGSVANSLMQSIASEAGDFVLIGQ